MFATLTQAARRGVSWTLATPLRAAFTHGNQALVTLASAFMNAQFAQSHNILDPWIAWLLAVGYEWTYLRGLASSSKTQSQWTVALNGVAFATAIIGGLLYCADRYQALPSHPDDWLAWALAAAHVLPMALLSLCSAMVHRAASAGQVAREEAREQAQLQLAIEREQKEQDLVLWERGQRMKRMLDAELPASPASASNAAPPPPNALRADLMLHRCASCGASLNRKQFAASVRWGRCGSCPKERRS